MSVAQYEARKSIVFWHWNSGRCRGTPISPSFGFWHMSGIFYWWHLESNYMQKHSLKLIWFYLFCSVLIKFCWIDISLLSSILLNWQTTKFLFCIYLKVGVASGRLYVKDPFSKNALYFFPTNRIYASSFPVAGG